MKTIKQTLEQAISDLDNTIYTVRSAGTARGLRDIKKSLSGLLLLVSDKKPPVVKVMAAHRYDSTIMIVERLCANEISANAWLKSEEGLRVIGNRHVQLVWEDVL